MTTKGLRFTLNRKRTKHSNCKRPEEMTTKGLQFTLNRKRTKPRSMARCYVEENNMMKLRIVRNNDESKAEEQKPKQE